MWELEFQSAEQVDAGETGSVVYVAHWNEFVNAQRAMWPPTTWQQNLHNDLATTASEVERTGNPKTFQFRTGDRRPALITVSYV